MDNPQIEYYDNGNIERECWNENGQSHRLDGPADIFYYENGHLQYEHWHKNNQLHRLDGPAFIWYYENGDVKIKRWYVIGKEIDPPYDNYPLTKEQQIELKLRYG